VFEGLDELSAKKQSPKQSQIVVETAESITVPAYNNRKRRFVNSVISNQRPHHPMAHNETVQSSLIDFIYTFDCLPRYPANMSELIRSSTFYMILSKMEPAYFPPLHHDLLSKDINSLTIDNVRLRQIYKELLTQMEHWFNDQDKSDIQINFDADMINVKRLIDN
jgi:hypothetical protein